jgi:hypothetical protein
VAAAAEAGESARERGRAHPVSGSLAGRRKSGLRCTNTQTVSPGCTRSASQEDATPPTGRPRTWYRTTATHRWISSGVLSGLDAIEYSRGESSFMQPSSWPAERTLSGPACRTRSDTHRSVTNGSASQVSRRRARGPPPAFDAMREAEELQQAGRGVLEVLERQRLARTRQNAGRQRDQPLHLGRVVGR